MKKQIIAIAILSAAVCLTGCTVNISDDTVSQAADIAASVLEETDITLNGQPVDVSLDSEGNVSVSIGQTTADAAQTTQASAETTQASAGQTADNTNIEPLIGEWYYQEQDSQNGALYNMAGFVTVKADSTYLYQPRNGAAPKKGTVKVDYDEYGNGDKVPFWAFYDNDGNFFIGIYCTQEHCDTFYVGNGGSERIVRKTENENPYDEYVGTWQCDRCSIRISDVSEQGYSYDVEIHWADSASEDNVWTYSCFCSDDGTYIECTDGGTLTHIVTADDGTETRTVVYNDGAAKFNIKGGTLFWQDVKEDKGHQMGFVKLG
ncbi:MAG: hypothetical protein IK134_01295 [Oscillospiraceae bacterium]|nr:hypothetical protein [Oscillospiraceae bacterium]MBR5361948.1 hypothetical protein [Oscillospiraceae bacterium]